MTRAYIVGAGNTRFGRLEGRGPLALMAEAAEAALDDGRLQRGQVDGLLCGYATTLPHLMLSTLFAERFSLQPLYAHGVQLGGATGAAMLMLAGDLVRAGRCRTVLVVAGEDRLSGQSRDASIQTLAQVSDADYEVPNGATVPAYYALLASQYMHTFGLSEADLAQLAVLMRSQAQTHPDAHLRSALTLDDVLKSKPIATPLKLLDCCPISDGAVALVVSSAAQGDGDAVRIAGAGQAHLHQHLSSIESIANLGARESANRAFVEAGLAHEEIDYLAIYDSFSITLAILLEELGFAPRGGAGERARAGDFNSDGKLALNTHGGLLSFGHSGVAGGLAHAAEAYRQLAGRAGDRQAGRRSNALLHADAGIMSSHISIVLRTEGR